MVRIVTALGLAAALSTSSAYVPADTSSSTRRAAFGQLASGLFGIASLTTFTAPQSASATPAKTGAASVFTGEYDDPNHPGCLRSVKVVGPPLRADGTRSAIPLVEVKGYDGKDGESMCKARPTRDELWKVDGKLIAKDSVVLDFSVKGGPSNLKGQWDGSGIVFPDGNKWTKVPTPPGTPDRRPADMSTLKSD